MLDFAAVNAAALAGLRALLPTWLPGGTFAGNEFSSRNPTRDDATPGSFSVNASTGIWADFATGDKGGDPISLYAYIKRIKQGESCKEIAAHLGMSQRRADQSRTMVFPAPADAPPAPTKWGRIEADKWVPYPISLTHPYRTATGGLYGYVVRYETPTGKETVPLTAWKHESGAVKWHQKSFPKPRPLYNLDRLAHAPAAAVVLVEGEKCADALQGIVDGAMKQADIVATTWPGGARAIQHADLSPLRGRAVILWPDNDIPGRRAMDDAAATLAGYGCRLKTVAAPVDAPDGWDIADGILQDQWDFGAIIAHIRSAATAVSVPTVTPVTTPAPTPTVAEAPYGRCIYDYGDSQKLNQSAIAYEYVVDSGIIHDPSVDRFYIYEPPTGLWVYQTDDVTIRQIGQRFQAIVIREGYADMVVKRTAGMLTDLCKLIRGISEKRDVFINRPTAIHVSNCMLDLNNGAMVTKSFARDYYSRNRAEIRHKPGAQCPRFMSELMKSAIDDDDISLIQRYVGQCLLGDNPSQTFLILRGTPGGGKGTLTNIIEIIIGVKNVTELRMDHLSERFELYRYVDKTLICGKDVPGTFLNSKPAHIIKKLVGGDVLSGEAKHGNDTYVVKGNFNVIITTNTRLRVKLDSDLGAWRRRMLIVDYERESAEKPIAHFDEQLITEEGEGILQWAIAGAMKLKQELREFGRIQLTEKQQARVDDLLYESDAVSSFVRERIVCDPGCDLSVTEITNAYRDYCESRNWEPLKDRQFQFELPEAMLSLLRIHKGSHIMRDGKDQRGFSGVALKDLQTGKAVGSWD